MERLIGEGIDDETALLYSGKAADPYEISRIKESPLSWYSSEEGVRDLEAGVALLKEIIAIQDDPAKDSTEKTALLAPLLVKLREEYGV